MTVIQHRWKVLGAWAVVPLLAFVVAGCSPQPNSGNDKGPPLSVRSFDEWQVDYASCMRSEGVDVPDPDKNSNKAMAATNERSPLFEAANQHCLDKIGQAPVSEQHKSPEEAAQGVLDSNKCLRENGIDVKDPIPGQMTVLPRVSQDILDKCGLVGIGAGK